MNNPPSRKTKKTCCFTPSKLLFIKYLITYLILVIIIFLVITQRLVFLIIAPNSSHQTLYLKTQIKGFDFLKYCMYTHFINAKYIKTLNIILVFLALN